MITSLNYIGISVPDMFKAKQFFIEVLGFRELEISELRELGSQLLNFSYWPENHNLTFVFLKHPNGLQIGLADNYKFPSETSSVDTHIANRQYHLSFSVPDLQNALDVLRKYPDVHIEYQSLKKGNRYVYFAISWGMYIQLTENDEFPNITLEGNP